MYFRNLLNSFGLSREIFMPFDFIEHDTVETNELSTVESSSPTFDKREHHTPVHSRCEHNPPESLYDQTSYGPVSVVPSGKTCVQCDHCRQYEDLENGSDNYICDGKGGPIRDVSADAMSCSLFACSEQSEL